jgi:diacylglycerol kinase (ATP)
MRRRFALVFNARAGFARPRRLREVLGHLSAAGAEVLPVIATSAAEASSRVAELARAGEVEAMIAAGGDGTIRAVATGVAGTDVPVGLIPLGTGNVMKHEIGLGIDPANIARVLLEGEAVAVKGGLVNGAPFFLMAGAGFDGHIVSMLDYRHKRHFGRAAYTGPVLKALAPRPPLFDAEVDGRTFEASWVIVTNASRYGGSFVLTRETWLGAGQLEAIVVTGTTRRALVAAALALAAGRLGDPRRAPAGVHVLPATNVRLGLHKCVHAEVDGDEAGTTPLHISADGPTVRFLMPAAHVAASTKRHTNRLE